MLKNGRIYIYLLITALTTLLNFLFELDDSSLEEAIYETFIIFPLTFLFIFLIFKLRIQIYRIQLINRYLSDPIYVRFMIPVVVILQTFIIGFVIKFITEKLFNDDADAIFFDLVFWAIIVISFINILFVYLFEHFLLTLEKKHLAELEISKHKSEKIISKYLSLKKQLNPHFLFNSFNSLSALIHIDTDKADAFLQELSNVYRYNLDYSEELVVTVEKELEFIKSYMALQRIRFREGITIKYQIEAPKMKYLLPPMTLELLVENAIKHNIIEKSRPLVISVTTVDDYIVVENNFQPRTMAVDKSSSLGIGLKNLKNQYELIHINAPTFTIENEQYIARIPLITPEI